MGKQRSSYSTGNGSSGNPVGTMDTTSNPPPSDSPTIGSGKAPVAKPNESIGSAGTSFTSSPALSPDPTKASHNKAPKYHRSVPLEEVGAKLQKYVPFP